MWVGRKEGLFQNCLVRVPDKIFVLFLWLERSGGGLMQEMPRKKTGSLLPCVEGFMEILC